MTCDERRADLILYLDGELGPAERTELEAHLATCPVCPGILEAERRLSGALGALPGLEPSGDFEARFWARVAREQEAPGRGFAGLFSRRLVLALGGVSAAALALVIALRVGPRPRSEPEPDLQIVANSEDYELLEDPDLDVIAVVDLLESWDGDQDQPG
jgi:anti-sigma factor RsiW